VLPVARAVRSFRNGGEREAYIQVRPNEIEACSFGLILDAQRFVKQVAHTNSLYLSPHFDRFGHHPLHSLQRPLASSEQQKEAMDVT
jgi:hypothetical protein